MRNLGDWVSFIAAQGMKRNTDGHKHDNIGYNDEHYRWDERWEDKRTQEKRMEGNK